MKKITVFILSVLFSFPTFAHKAQKQAEPLMMEGLTQKWMECESAEEAEFKKHLDSEKTWHLFPNEEHEFTSDITHIIIKKAVK